MRNLVSVDTLIVSLFLIVAIPAGKHQAASADIGVRAVFSWVQQVVAVVKVRE
jgi:competence protein ComGC